MILHISYHIPCHRRKTLLCPDIYYIDVLVKAVHTDFDNFMYKICLKVKF